MAIRTIYEISKPDQQFYSVERAGYSTVNAAAVDIGTDLVKLGAFTLSSLVYETVIGGTPKNVVSTSWPPANRKYTLNAKGAGYKVGDKLKLVGGTGTAPFAITVSTISSTDGSIATFAVDNVGKYTVIPGPSSNLQLDYVDPTYKVAEITIQGNLTASTGAGIVPPGISAVADNNQSQWITNYGANGGGGTLGTRWPQNGAWVLSSTAGLSNIKPGANVFVVSSTGISSISTGTTVASIYTGVVVTGTANAEGRSWMPPMWVETTSPATFIAFSQPVTLNKGDKIGFKGIGATFDNSVVTTPDQWTGIFEATGATDPLNDNVGVFGNVTAGISNSTQVQITNILTTNTYNPVIYEGHTVSSLPDDPNPVPAGVTVVAVENYYTTSNVGVKTFKANVTLSSNVSLETNKTLRFRFAQPQPWRLALEVQNNLTNPGAGSQILNVYAATDLQLTNEGNISKVYDSAGTQIDSAGLMGDVWSVPSLGRPDVTQVSQGFYNREVRVGASPENYPLNYSVTLTNRGVFVGMWEGNWSTMQKATVAAGADNYFNWFLIQRAVNRTTGRVVTTGRCPVFCINAVGYKYWKFIVREEDVIHPTVGPADSKYRSYNPLTNTFTDVTTPYRVAADYHTVDSFALLNTTNQISLTEDSKYLLSFVNNLTTPRFRYSDELDMIGQTSADVVGQGVELPINAYGQTLPRYYRALPANNKFNTGLRICVLKDIPSA